MELFSVLKKGTSHLRLCCHNSGLHLGPQEDYSISFLRGIGHYYAVRMKMSYLGSKLREYLDRMPEQIGISTNKRSNRPKALLAFMNF